MSNCSGCGVKLQFDNKELEGFAHINSSLCERCFRINNYNEYKYINKNNDDFINILKNINKTKNLVVLVIDLFNIPLSLSDINKYIKNDILLVLTKRDLIPLSVYDKKVLDYFDIYNLNIIDKIIISSINNYNFDVLFNNINKYKKSKNVYIVGYTNAGKSTMINKLIYNYSKYNSSITTSNLPSTTLNSINVKLSDDLTLIDTPGLIESGNIINHIEPNMIKLIIPKKEIKPITYQIKEKQYIFIDKLLIVECNKYNSLTFYFSNSLQIKRRFKGINNNLVAHTLSAGDNQDIVINGLGFIKVVKKCEIVIYTLENVDVYKRKALI